MSFSVSRNLGNFEWSGSSIFTIFAQIKNLCSYQMWRMIFDIVRFNHFALDLLRYEENENVNAITLGEFLEKENYSSFFCENYLIPMTAAIWSTSPQICRLEFPMVTLARFM
jgi:predicted NAD/FAD-binding protein